MIEGQTHLIEQALTYPFETIIDISGGQGGASRRFHAAGKTVTMTAFQEAYAANNFPTDVRVMEHTPITQMSALQDASFDAVWCSHVLEHCTNTGLALDEMYRTLKPGGWLFLMVPPFKPNVVGGHVNVGWNIGILMYTLLLHGFAIKQGHYIRHGYNIAAFVPKPKEPIELPSLLHDDGDLDALQIFFPDEFPARQNMNGDIASCQWEWRVPHALGLKRRIKRHLKNRLLKLVYYIG